MRKLKNRIGFALFTLASLSSYGQVGIGTFTPRSELDIAGNMVIGASFSGNSSVTAPSNGLLIQGRVGLGVSVPESQLHVDSGNSGFPALIETNAFRGGIQLINIIESGSDNQNEIRFECYDGSGISDAAHISFLDSNYSNTTNGGNYANQLAFSNRRTSGNFGYYFGSHASANTRKLLLENDGDLRITGSLYSNASIRAADSRLMSDLRLVENATPLLLSLNPVSYLKKDTIDSKTDGLKEFGFIAQELKEKIPKITKEVNDEGVLAVDYQSLIPILVKGFQEQDRQSDVIESEINELEKKLAKLP